MRSENIFSLSISKMNLMLSLKKIYNLIFSRRVYEIVEIRELM